MSLAIIGCGGHGRVILDIARRCGHTVVFFLDDDPTKHGKLIHGVRVLGPSNLLLTLHKARRPQGVVVALGDNYRRAELFAQVRGWGFKTPNLIHPNAVLASHVGLGEGVVIMAGAVVNPGARLGHNVCVNTSASVDHDCLLRDHSHIYPGTTLTAGVEVGEYTYVGSGAVVNPFVKVGRESFVGTGAAVVDDVPDGVVVVGVPAKILKATAELRSYRSL